MRVEVPDTPRFHAELEARLMLATASRRRRRWRPVPTSALRALRELNIGALQVAFAVAVAAVFLMLSPASVLHEADPLVAEPSETVPGFIRQYASQDDVTAFVERARAQGHEVVVVTDYVSGGAPEGTIIDVRMLGDRDEVVAFDANARSPIVVVMGVHFSTGSSVAD